LGRAILRSYPFARGSWRLNQLVTRAVSLPDRATFEFDYGTFVDTSLAEWPDGYRELFLHGSMEKNELAAWKHIVRPGDAVIDGGANYGYWTLVASRLVGPTGKVFSFEANPPTAARLKENIHASSAKNISVYPVALAAADGTAQINNASSDSIGSQASLTRQKGLDWGESTEIRTTAGDSLASLDHWPRIRLIKLDIEGAELAALQGMANLIERDKPVLTVEWNVATAAAFGYHPSEVISLLRKHGYSPMTRKANAFLPLSVPDERHSSMLWFLPPPRSLTETY
jgi:FkbM family methyltransferase